MAQSFSWAVPAQTDEDPAPPKRPTDKPLLSLAPAAPPEQVTSPAPVWSELPVAPEAISWPDPPVNDAGTYDVQVVVDSAAVDLPVLDDEDWSLEDNALEETELEEPAHEEPAHDETELEETPLFDQTAPDPAPSAAFASGVAAAFTVTRTPLSVAQVRDGVPLLVSVNPAYCELTGCAADDVLGGDPLPMRSPECDPAALALLTAAMADGATVTSPLLCMRVDGTRYWAEITVSLVGVLLIIEQRDMSSQLAAEAEQWRAMHVDPVTGSAARALADEAIAGHVAAGRPFGVLLVRIFGVQQRNRDGGYAAGDAALTATADRLVTTLAGRGRLARHVGTQFVVVVDELGADGRGLSHDLADELELAASVDGLRAFAGTALFPTDADTASELLDVARSQFETVRRQSRTRVGRLVWRAQWMLSQR